MSQELRADYRQRLLLPPSVEDWIPSDHMARFVREFVDSMDLVEIGIKERKGDEGRPNYAADLLLKVWLYGYLQRIRSSRKLERACLNEVGLIWLTGMHYPDHNTLWRFWRDNGRVMKEVFQKTVKVAMGAGLVGMVVHAVDGTKIVTKSSMRTMLRKKELEKLLKRVERSIQEMMVEVEQAEREEVGEYRLPEEMKDQERLREKIQQGLAELEKEGRTQMHPGEPEARVVKTPEGNRLGYNAQAVVDDTRGIVVAGDVTTEENDCHQLTPMLEKVKEGVGRVADETVADAGYCLGQELAKAEECGYEVVVNLRAVDSTAKRAGRYHASNFIYDEQKDCMTCPEGEALVFCGTSDAHEGRYKFRRYRCQSYKDCSVRGLCSKANRGRVVKLSPYHGVLIRQKEKQKDPVKAELLKKRMSTAEPVMGWVKHLLGFRRWSVSGHDKVQNQWMLMCTTVNLAKLFQEWQNNSLQWA